MSHPHPRRRTPPLPLALPLLLLLLGPPAAAADGPAPKPDPDAPRAAVAKSLAPAGTLLRRTARDKPWEAVEPKADVSSRDLLLALPVSQAAVESKNGAVRLLFWGNLPQISPFPILESAVVLHATKDVDLDLSPQRGRVVVSNTKEKGAARVRVRLPGTTWELALSAPGSEVALEMFGRWPRGVVFQPGAKEPDAPALSMVLLVLKGDASLKSGGETYGLGAAPGANYFHWDNAAGSDPAPRRLDKLPEWTAKKVPNTPEAKAALAVLEEVAKKARDKSPAAVMAGLMKAADDEEDAVKAGVMRRGAVFGSAALDNLPVVVGALPDKHAEVREAAVEALRAWIGRGPGQDQALYDFLQKEKKFTKTQAEIAVQLLLSYDEDDLEKPETYESLIAYLRNERPAIRELAAWHLYRVAPAGKDIPYDPSASKEGLDKAYKAWKKLVPTGKLPPKPKAGG